MGWTVETVSAVDAEIEVLPVALRERLIRFLEALRTPHARHLESKLWELRVRADGGNCQRDLCDGGRTADGGSACLWKNSRKTPRRALATFRERMRQVT